MGLCGRRSAAGVHERGTSAPWRDCPESALLAERLGKRGRERRRNSGVSSGWGEGAWVREKVGVWCRIRRVVGVVREVVIGGGCEWVFWDGCDDGGWERFFEGVARGWGPASWAAAARFDFEGVGFGESRSKSPSTRPFFCGVGPMMVRGGLGVSWDGRSYGLMAEGWCRLGESFCVCC